MSVPSGFSPVLEADWLDLAASIGEAFSIEEVKDFDSKKAKQKAKDERKKSLKALKAKPKAKLKPKAKAQVKPKKKKKPRVRTREQETLKKQRQSPAALLPCCPEPLLRSSAALFHPSHGRVRKKLPPCARTL